MAKEDNSKYIRYDHSNSLYKGDNNFRSLTHERFYQEAIDDPVKFWADKANEVHWYKPYEKVLDDRDIRFPKWFVGGEINITYNCIDRHILEGRGDMPAFHEVNCYTGKNETITYNKLKEEVGRLASVLQNQFGIKKGDRVIIYMPMVRQIAISMLACARIGAIHSVVFGGFAAKELANRIDDCNPQLIISATVGIEPTKKIRYLPIVAQALKECSKTKNASSIPKLFFNRLDVDPEDVKKDNLDSSFHDMQTLVNKETRIAEPVPCESTHPLYILYTSGTTGQPKGVVRDQGGTTVALNWGFKSTFNYHPGGSFFGAADAGWIVGHSMMIYGALVRGIASVIYEGKPIYKGDAGVLFDICSRYKIDHMFTSTTAVKEMIRLDPEGNFFKRINLDEFKILTIGGECVDPKVVWWLRRHLPKVIHNDTWWPTENGWPMGNNMFNQDIYGPVFPTLPGSIPRISPGWNLRVLNENN